VSNLTITAVLTTALFFLISCSDAPKQTAEPATLETQSEAEAGILDLQAGWNSISPEGETTCSDGSPYRFFVRPGSTSKLLVYMQGGGACWFRENCDPEMRPTYSINVGENFHPGSTGIFNYNNATNPFNDYSVVMAPYCTGDVHMGARDTVYPGVEPGQDDLLIRHQGRANMQAVLDWTYANVPQADEIFVTGSSAGAIPSPFYASVIADHYSDAKVAQLGDGAGGYRRINQDSQPDEQWGTFDFLNQQKGFENEKPEGFNYERLYIAAAKAHPEILFAKYDAAEDGVQKQFLALGGSETTELKASLTANHDDIRAEAENFRAYIGGGASHTILRRPEFYAYAANGVSIRDWITSLVTGTDSGNVTCILCDEAQFTGSAFPPAMQQMWDIWEDAEQQHVAPFQIFDNLYYVGIDWVAAYVLETSDGLILIDSLYGKWTTQLIKNIRELGLDPSDVKYVINTHGHFDHAGGSAAFQTQYGSRIVMTAEDWGIALAEPEDGRFYQPTPARDITAVDGDVIVLGDSRVEMFNTPGHTEGVLTLRYTVRDGADEYTAITLGGVGLNFSGVERTETYLESYARLQAMQDGVSVSLPNHALMGGVFKRRAALTDRAPGDAHPYVDAQGYRSSLAKFVANAETKLAQEKAGTAKDPLEELTNALIDGDNGE
jgi:glyoxylase-like metal-dependent hydrolase (beta-lactamase superfamily II)